MRKVELPSSSAKKKPYGQFKSYEFENLFTILVGTNSDAQNHADRCCGIVICK